MPSHCIVLTDGETRAALAAARSLGCAGHRIHVTCSKASSLAGASRYVIAEHVLPDAEYAATAWSGALEALCERVGADYVLPMTELAMGTVHATGFAERHATLCPSADAYAAAVDKFAILAAARRAGLDVPRTVLIEDPAMLDALPEGFAYPVILKARRSRFWRDDRWLSGGVATLASAADLVDAKSDPGFSGGALLQEFVPGHGEAVFLLVHGGECLATFAHERLREKPPSGGVSVLRRSIAPDPALLSGSTKLLAEIGLNGVAMVEFRRSPDGTAALMEINPRFWGSLQLAIDAGVDFPALLVAAANGRIVTAPPARPDVRMRWLLGDLDHLLISLRRRTMREATGRSRVRVVVDFLKSFADGTRLEVFRRDDPRPFLREILQWASRRR